MLSEQQYDISIIIPHFNTTKKLLRLINSIYQKEVNFDRLEVIIIDDNSDEDLESIIKYIDKLKNIRVVKNNSGTKGAGACRNIGINLSSGKWLIFADSDDYFTSNYYEIITGFIESKNEIIFFPPTSINELDGSVSNRHEFFEDSIMNYLDEKSYKNELILKYKIVVPWSKMYSTKLIKKNHIYFDEILVSNDVLFSNKTGLYADRIGVSKDNIYCVTKDIGTLTTTFNKKNYYTRLEVFVRSAKFLKCHLSNADYKKLNINGAQMIINTYIYKVKLRDKINTIYILKKNKINLIDWKKLNLLNIRRIIMKIISEFKYRAH